MNAVLKDWAMSAPEGWGTWPPGAGAEHADRVASELSSSPEAAEVVRAAVLWMDRTLPRDERPLLTAGIWVPDPANGEMAAFLVAEVVMRGTPEQPATVEDYVKAVSRRRRPRGVKVFSSEVSRTTVPAGPAVVELLVSAERRSSKVTCEHTWSVFPPGTIYAIQLHFSTLHPALQGALVEQAAAIASSLSVELGDE